VHDGVSVMVRLEYHSTVLQPVLPRAKVSINAAPCCLF